MEAPLHVTTSSVAPRRRLAYWNEAAVSTFGPLVVDSSVDAFSAELTHFPLKSIDVCSAESSAAQINRGSHHFRGSREEVLNIVLQDIGPSLFNVCGQDCEMSPGDFVILDPSRTYTIRFDDPIRCIILRMPRRRLGHRAERLDAIMGRRIDGAEGGPKILSDFVRTAWRQMKTSWSDDWASSLDAGLWNLIDLTCSSQAPAAERSKAQYWQAKAKAFVSDNLCDPELRAGTIAAGLGLSERYVHSLFAADTTTPSNYILAERLEQAATRLARFEVRTQVTNVALDLGFNDLSYFSRTFRKRFGVSPRQWQVAHRLA